MAGFFNQTVQPQGNGRGNNNMYVEELPYYGYGFYYNPGIQNINEGVTPQYGDFNGSGVSGKSYSLLGQRQMHHYKPNGANSSNGSATWVQVGPNPYYMNRGTQTIQADHVVQRGSFQGRGMGARLRGHFSVSGDIN